MGRPPLSTTVLPVLKSVLIRPPGAVFVPCDLPVLLHALLHVAAGCVHRFQHAYLPSSNAMLILLSASPRALATKLWSPHPAPMSVVKHMQA